MSASTKDCINIAIAINDGFMMPAEVMLNSLLKKVSQPIRVYLLYNSLSKNNRAVLKTLIESFSCELIELYIDEEYFRNASLSNNPMYSVEIYYRILLPYLIEDDKILWLDSDIIVTKNISELYEKDITDFYVAACIDIVEERGGRDEIKKAMDMNEHIYFNSGVLLLNTKKIRDEISERTFFDAIDRYNDVLKCPDQDILNYVLGTKCLDLPVYYNYQHHNDNDCDAESGMILHYIWKKPWNADYPGYLEKQFWDEAVACGFSKEYKAFKRKRKMLFYKNELIPAAISKFTRKK